MKKRKATASEFLIIITINATLVVKIKLFLVGPSIGRVSYFLVVVRVGGQM